MKRKKRKYSYNSRDPFDLAMILDEEKLLDAKGRKKRRSWIRRDLI